MESHSGQKWSRLFLRVTSPDVIPSSEMQIHPFRIDIDLSRFVLVGREFFWPVEKFFHRSRIFYRSRIFCTSRELFCRSRIFCTGGEIFLSIENYFTGREFFAPVENSLCWSKSFWPIESVFLIVVEKFFGLSIERNPRSWTRNFCGQRGFRAKTYHVV